MLITTSNRENQDEHDVLVGGVDFSKLSMTLQGAAGDVAAVSLNSGAFIQSILDEEKRRRGACSTHGTTQTFQ